MTALSDLIAKLEAAPGDDPELFEQIGQWAERNIEGFSLFRWHELCAIGAFLCAALTLVPEGWHWTIEGPDPLKVVKPYCLLGLPGLRETEGNAATAALALCIAALRAREAL
ncbi:MAG: hypothetical protein Q7S17_06555 [Xanthobacteraceae bacterium]|nr:hypothetical protein [Xanthobacteraceae bacterium]